MTVRVLIVDDSSFFQRRLSDIISKDNHLEIVGIANNGKDAIEQVKLLKPDVITMDIEMPIMDGISATAEIMKIRPTPILIISSWSVKGAQETLRALEAGAIDYLPKGLKEDGLTSQSLCLQLRTLSSNFHSVAFKNKQERSQSPNIESNNRTLLNSKIKLIAIGASTGGPVAIQHVLSHLPNNYPFPILLIQHMPGTFTPSFAERLNTQCKITVKHAQNKELLVAGTAYLAPGGQQMVIKGNTEKAYIEIQDNSPDTTYSPCIDVTLNSIATVFPNQCLSIILTGMGSDGTEGCKKLKSTGCMIWSQDEQSSTIYGMPRSVAQADIVDKVLNLDDIATRLTELY